MADGKSEAVISVDAVSLRFGGVSALADVTLEVGRHEILAIIGPNGAGKTSLLNCITGYYVPQKGDIYFQGVRTTRLPAHEIAKLGVTRTFQKTELFTGLSVLDNLLAARHPFIKYGPLAASVFFGRAQKEEIRNREIVEDIIDFLEMEPIRKKVVGTLPHGLRKRVELGRALALEPKVLLLDEPTGGMNVEEKEEIVRFILDIFEERVIPIVLIEHDMGVVMDIAQRVVVLDFGRKIAEGTPAEVTEDGRVIGAYLGEELEEERDVSRQP